MSVKFFTILLFVFSGAFFSMGQRANVKAPQEKLGGYLIFEKDNHGLVATTKDIGQFDYPNAKSACENLVLNGFDDWRLPTQEEFELIHQKLNLKKMKSNNVFKSAWYWTSSEIDQEHAVTHNLNTGMQTNYFKRLNMRVIAVRSF
ncbi:Lcl domain-containing protein [Aquirufa aurantiipilula]